jgi:anaerobic magnesium-protoporphyrin IX monomethyl ester cyclase
MTRVLLVNLPHRERLQRRWVASYYAPNFLLPPLELLTLASALKDVAEVRLVDAIAEGLSASEVSRRYAAFAPQFVVALTGFAVLDDDLKTLGAIRDALPGARSVAFGHLPTWEPAVIAARPEVDFVVRGEPEDTLIELFSGVDPGDVAGLAFEDVQTADRPRLTDLDRFAPPDHRLVDLRLYQEPFMPRPIGVLESARGCPYSCSFCVRAYGQRIEAHSVDWILGAVGDLRSAGAKHFRFLDDTFTYDQRRVLEVCDGLRREHPGMTWTALTRADRLNAEVAKALRAAGCLRLYVGVESADPEVLRQWGKGESVEQIRAGCEAARAVGIELNGFFVVGAEGETTADAARAARFAAQLDLDFVIVTRLQVWPGTELYKQRGPLAPEDWGIEPAGDPFAVERELYRRFYLRPRSVLRSIRRAAEHPRDAAVGLTGLGRYVAGAVRHRDFI